MYQSLACSCLSIVVQFSGARRQQDDPSSWTVRQTGSRGMAQEKSWEETETRFEEDRVAFLRVRGITLLRSVVDLVYSIGGPTAVFPHLEENAIFPRVLSPVCLVLNILRSKL